MAGESRSDGHGGSAYRELSTQQGGVFLSGGDISSYPRKSYAKYSSLALPGQPVISGAGCNLIDYQVNVCSVEFTGHGHGIHASRRV